MTKLPAILLAALLLLWGVLIYAVFSPVEKYPGASTHPEHSQMHVAGASAEFDAGMTVPGAIAGVLIITTYLLCLLIGAGKNGASRKFVGVVVASSCLVIGSFLAMTFSVGGYVRDSSPQLVGGFPVPTAWMVFGVWLSPIVFLAIYIAGFRQWVMTDDDRQRLAELVAARNSESHAEST
jgi:hypothetical protein